MPFTARTRIALAEAAEIASRLAERIGNLGVAVADAHGKRLDFSTGYADFLPGYDGLTVTMTAQTIEALEEQKYYLASNLGLLVAETRPEILWQGDGGTQAGLPNLRVMRVEAVRDLTPRMRRITFLGENLARFDTLDNLHVRLLLPPPGVEPTWPSLGCDGRMAWPDGPLALAARAYTIRSVDADRGTLDIDFVVHGDAGPGTAFATRARRGDRVGLMGPGGLSARPADWYLLAGDETALPAISRIVESLPSSAKAVVRLDVSDRRDELPLASAADLDVVWLHRSGSDRAPGRRLVEAVRAVSWPRGAVRSFAWVGCEHRAFRAIRDHLRQDQRLPKDRHLATAYWRAS